ncbi:MAG: Flp pilus assembly protein CpaB [Cystobacterineae bacterium]|nr:Flp pilus assembly protein CpaB [Cystobacterineae bacterium]
MPLVLAFCLAAFAGVLAFTAIKNQEQAVTKGWALKRVLVVNEDVAEGTEITEDMLQPREMPERFISPSNIGIDSRNLIQGHKILVDVKAGDPLLWTQFSMMKNVERLSTKVLKRMRAYTLNVTGASAVGRWIRPNDRVDIIWVFKDPQTQENVATTIKQNVVVLATGLITGSTNMALTTEEERSYSEISLMVLPEEVEQLALAQDLGTLLLSLRNEEDADSVSGGSKTTSGTLFDSNAQKNTDTKRNTMTGIEVVRSSGGGAAR